MYVHHCILYPVSGSFCDSFIVFLWCLFCMYISHMFYVLVILSVWVSGSAEHRTLLSQMKREYEETARDIVRLVHARSQIDVLISDQFSVDVPLLFSLTKPTTPLLVTPTANNPTLQFQLKQEYGADQREEILYAGKPVGLVAHLYARYTLLLTAVLWSLSHVLFEDVP